MKREDEILMFFTEDLDNLMKQKIKDGGNIKYFKNEVLKLKVIDECKEKIVYYDLSNNCEINDIKRNSFIFNAKYSLEKQGFEATVLTSANKDVIFLYIKNNILYMTQFETEIKYFFPCESGIPNSQCIKEVQIDKKNRIVEYNFIYDFNNNEFAYFRMPHFYKEISSDFRIPHSYKEISSDILKNWIDSSSNNKRTELKTEFQYFFPRKYTYVFPDNCKQILEKLLNGDSIDNYIDNLIKKCKDTRCLTKKTTSIIGSKTEAKTFIDSVSDYNRIRKLMKNKNTYIINNSNSQTTNALKCMHCSSETMDKPSDMDLCKNTIECPVCHQKSMLVNSITMPPYKRMYFELLPNKNVLLVCFLINSQREEIRQVWVFSPEGIDVKIDLDNNCNYNCQTVNTPEEIKAIFDNSNIAYAGIPYILGVESEDYSEMFFDIFTSKNNIFHHSQKDFKALADNFIRHPILKKILIECGINFFYHSLNLCITKEAESVEEFFEISHEKFETLKKLNMLDSAYLLQRCQALNILSEIRPNESIENVCRFIQDNDLFCECDIKKTLFYKILLNCPTVSFLDLKRYLNECYCHQGIDIYNARVIYNKYFKLALKLGYNMNNKNIVFPNSLKKQYNIATMAYNATINSFILENFKNKYYKNRDNLEYDYAGYAVIIPKYLVDLIKEGCEQNHCIAAYINKINEERSVICFIRKSEDLQTPLYTVEIDISTKVILQIKGKENKNPDEPAVLDFIEKWMKEKELVWKC